MFHSRIHIPLTSAVRMVSDYASRRIKSQIRSVSFIIVYLVAFQLLVFGRPPHEAFRVAAGIGIVILGLTFFLEGVLLGLMPIGERIGLSLPSHGGLLAIIPFGILLGFGATFAEPAIASLRMAAGAIRAWESPLLFYLLEQKPYLLITVVGIGAGIAVAVGMTRFFTGFSIKPLIMIISTALIALTVFFSRSSTLSSVLGLAWDTGAVTTGPVTVPLVMALGIGVSRSSGKSTDNGQGFGIVMLASALPVLCVMGLSLILSSALPGPMSEKDFFLDENREKVLTLFSSEEEFDAWALVMKTTDSKTVEATQDDKEVSDRISGIFIREIRPAFWAVLPLAIFLCAVLFLLLKDRPRYMDEVALGIIFAFIGMALLTTGINAGLGPLGRDAGQKLPEIYRENDEKRIVIQNFSLSLLTSAIRQDGQHKQFFYHDDGKNIQIVPFIQENHDPVLKTYTHKTRNPILIHPELSRIGILLILLFAFGIGYGSTLAEPALKALGKSVEMMSIGTIRQTAVIHAVSIGVGAGLVLGVFRILYNIPVVWILVPPYILLLPLTLISDENIAGIAWDSGGVTTGPVTVPLVLAMGLGLGEKLGIADGFGILALASVYPVISVLLYGLVVRLRQKNIVKAVSASGGM